MFFEYDDKFNPVPLIAKSVDVLPDLKTYVFKIRDDVTWHDGKHLTGQDIVDTIQTVQSPDVPSLYILKRVIADAKGRSRTTTRFAWSFPRPTGRCWTS